MKQYYKIFVLLTISFLTSFSVLVAQLNSDRTYYVSPTGSDSSDGLCPNSAFRTIQMAVDVVSVLNKNQYEVTIQLANGVYSESTVLRRYNNYGNVIIQGNSNNPDSVVISSTNVQGFYSEARGVKWILKNMKIQTTGSGDCVFVEGGFVVLQNVNFGPCGQNQIRVERNGRILVVGDYKISGNALRHIFVRFGGTIEVQNLSITLLNTPQFTEFINTVAGTGAYYNLTFSGSAIGKRYDVSYNGVINTFGGGATYFPGNSAGTNSLGGIYN